MLTIKKKYIYKNEIMMINNTKNEKYISIIIIVCIIIIIYNIIDIYK